MQNSNENLESGSVLQGLFVLDEISVVPCSEHAVIMSNARTGSTIEIHKMMSNLVSHCTSFRTIDEHVTLINQTYNLPSNISHELKSTLVLLNKFGMLLSAQTLKNTFITDDIIRTNADEEWVLGIHSCDRPESLRQMLASAKAYLTSPNSMPTLIFIDDSRDTQNQTDNKNIIHSFCQDLDMKFSYWNRADRQQYSLTLARQRPKLSTSIKWLLDPLSHNQDLISTGLAKNFIQLHAVNKKIIMIDDDCLIGPLYIEGLKSGTSLKLDQDVLSIFENRTQLENGTSALNINPFTEHLSTLGSHPNQHITTDKSLHVNMWKGATLQEMLSLHSEGNIGSTINSIAGAQNSRHMEFIYSNVDAIDQTEKFLQSTKHTEQIQQLTWVGPERSTLNRFSSFLCTTMSGLDASRLPAPTIPTGRNQDIFLGLMATYLHPKSQAMRFNWAMLHNPQPERTWNPNLPPTSVSYAPIVILRRVLEDCCLSCHLKSPLDRLTYYLNTLEQITLKAEFELDKFITEQITTYFSSELEFFNEIQQKSKDSPHYQAGLNSVIANKKMALMRLVKEPAKLKNDFINITSALVSALRDWPAIIQLAKPQEIK